MWGVTYLFFLPRSCCLYNGHQYCCLYVRASPGYRNRKQTTWNFWLQENSSHHEGVTSHQIVSVIPGLVATLTNVWGRCTAAQGRPECFRAGPDRLPNVNKITSSLFRWECQGKRDFAGGSAVKNSPPSAGGVGSIPGLERFPRVGHGNSLQDSCLENPMD